MLIWCCHRFENEYTKQKLRTLQIGMKVKAVWFSYFDGKYLYEIDNHKALSDKIISHFNSNDDFSKTVQELHYSELKLS